MQTGSIVRILVIVGLVCLASCKKDDHSHSANNTATIAITSPASAAAFAINDTVHIRATVNAQLELHGYEVFVRRKSDNLTVFSKEGHTHGTTVNVLEQWISTVSVPTDMVLEVVAILDHDGNRARKTVEFNCHP